MLQLKDCSSRIPWNDGEWLKDWLVEGGGVVVQGGQARSRVPRLVLVLLALGVTLGTELVTDQGGHLLPVEGVPVEVCEELGVSLALFMQLLVSGELLASLVPGARLLDLKCVDVCGDGLDVVLVNPGPLVVATKEPNLQVVIVDPAHHLGRPVGIPLLLGVDNLTHQYSQQ